MVASPDSQSKALMSLQEQYPPTRFNLLLPTTAAGDVTTWHRMSVSLVTIDPNPQKGDVYPVAARPKKDENGNDVKAGNKTIYEDLFSLARPATDRIGTAAGINYDPNRSKVLTATADYVVYETVGGIRRPDGSWTAFKATKEIDLRAIELEIREKETNRLALGIWGDEAKKAQALYRGSWGPAPDGSNYQRFYIAPEDMARAIEDRVRPAMIQWRKNKLMRAETGARLRVIRGLLGIRMQFTAEELALPFAVPRIDFVPPTDDKEVKRALIAHATQSMGSLYGAQSVVHIPDDVEVQEAPGEVMEAEFRVTSEAPAATETSQAAAGAPTEASKQPEPEDDGTHCMSCGSEVTDNIAKYSKQHYGETLCYRCQRNSKGGARA